MLASNNFFNKKIKKLEQYFRILLYFSIDRLSKLNRHNLYVSNDNVYFDTFSLL